MMGTERDGAEARISVALCTYNSGTYLEAQLRSILDQDVPVTEVVVGDDGSTDRTLELIATLADTHPRGEVVRVAFTEPSGGLVANFSRTLAACSGEFIALSDHDDVWRRDKTAVLSARLAGASDRPAMVFGDARLIDGDGAPTGASLFSSYGVSDEEHGLIEVGRGPEALIRRNIVTGATTMLTRDLLDVALPIPDGFVHDEWLAFCAAALGALLVEDEPVTDYRVHGTNQIGVPPQTLWGQARRAMGDTRERYIALMGRSRSLHERLAASGASDEVLELLAAKEHFESARASMPWLAPARLPGIVSRYRAGDYARFTHRPSLERWRDLAQRM